MRVRVQFIGRVQGVGFRATVRTIARAFSVTGWVRNEEDGSVVSEIQGERHDIDLLLARLRSRMDDMIRAEHAAEIPTVDGEDQFDIRR
ncbi:MAG: acylphosphatase [Phycisphaerales bacterium]